MIKAYIRDREPIEAIDYEYPGRSVAKDKCLSFYDKRVF